MALDPGLPATWCSADGGDPEFPTFASPPPGGITAWVTMRLTAIANGTDEAFDHTLDSAIDAYDARDAEREATWTATFGNLDR